MKQNSVGNIMIIVLILCAITGVIFSVYQLVYGIDNRIESETMDLENEYEKCSIISEKQYFEKCKTKYSWILEDCIDKFSEYKVKCLK